MATVATGIPGQKTDQQILPVQESAISENLWTVKSLTWMLAFRFFKCVSFGRDQMA